MTSDNAGLVFEYYSGWRGYLIQSENGKVVAYDDENGCSNPKPIKRLFIPVRTMKFIRNLQTLSNCSITVSGEPPYQQPKEAK